MMSRGVARIGVIARRNLDSVGFGVVGPKRATRLSARVRPVNRCARELPPISVRHPLFPAPAILEIAGDPSMASSHTVFALMPDGNGIVEFRRVGDDRRIFYPSGSAQPADAETVEKRIGVRSMLAQTRRVPSYRLHKPTGLAVVTIDGHDRPLLGPRRARPSESVLHPCSADRVYRFSSNSASMTSSV
jgi:hypothetical protein